MTYALFWDIDGTLLSTARAGVFALEQAALEVCGTRPDLAGLKTAGLTDGEVAALTIEHCEAEASPELVRDFLARYERHLPDRLHLRQGSLMPGAREILEDLAPRDEFACMLLTGNTPAGGRAKLAHYGIDGFFQGGAFCEDGEGRDAIARRARDEAARLHGGELDPDRFYVIGDTPHDVRCGKGVGARTIAVASGQYGLEELEGCEPWQALERLPHPGDFVELLSS
jgi:phosphoglycolate phosphatase